jgi:thiopeptide-type bacteriocin biosynthesis protein
VGIPIPPDGGIRTATALAALRSWTPAAQDEIARLKHLAAHGRLTAPLDDVVASLLHMSANRILRAEQRSHELALYDFLARHYGSVMARATTSAARPFTRSRLRPSATL